MENRMGLSKSATSGGDFRIVSIDGLLKGNFKPGSLGKKGQQKTAAPRKEPRLPTL